MTPLHEQNTVCITGKRTANKHWMWDESEYFYLRSFERQTALVGNHDRQLTKNWVELGNIAPKAKLVALEFIKYNPLYLEN